MLMHHSFIPRIKRYLKIRKFINVTHHLTIQRRKTIKFFTFGAENILITLNIYLFLKQEQKKLSNKEYPGTSLEVQWLRCHTSNQGNSFNTWVWNKILVCSVAKSFFLFLFIYLFLNLKNIIFIFYFFKLVGG